MLPANASYCQQPASTRVPLYCVLAFCETLGFPFFDTISLWKIQHHLLIRFLDCKADSIEKKLRIMMQMSLVLTWGARVPTVRMGRMVRKSTTPQTPAGQ